MILQGQFNRDFALKTLKPGLKPTIFLHILARGLPRFCIPPINHFPPVGSQYSGRPSRGKKPRTVVNQQHYLEHIGYIQKVFNGFTYWLELPWPPWENFLISCSKIKRRLRCQWMVTLRGRPPCCRRASWWRHRTTFRVASERMASSGRWRCRPTPEGSTTWSSCPQATPRSSCWKSDQQVWSLPRHEGEERWHRLHLQGSAGRGATKWFL